METRANYVAVGAFVLLGVAAVFFAALWLVRVQFRQSFDHYQTYITGSVTGLSKQSLVRLDGIEVGRVTDLDFDPHDLRIVVADIDIRSGIVLHQDATLTQESAGLTGQPYLQIDPGTAAAPVLKRLHGQEYPVIHYQASGLEQIEDTAPEIAAQLSLVSKRLAALLDDQNRQAIGDTLGNLRDITGVFARHHDELEEIASDGAKAAHNLADTTAELDRILAKSSDLPHKADTALTTLNDSIGRLGALTQDLDQIARENRPQLHEFTGVGLSQLTQLTSEVRVLVATLSHLSQQLDSAPNSLLFGDRREGYRPK